MLSHKCAHAHNRPARTHPARGSNNDVDARAKLVDLWRVRGPAIHTQDRQRGSHQLDLFLDLKCVCARARECVCGVRCAMCISTRVCALTTATYTRARTHTHTHLLGQLPCRGQDNACWLAPPLEAGVRGLPLLMQQLFDDRQGKRQRLPAPCGCVELE